MSENLNGRMAALTDGVVAIAMTLLMLDIRLPEAIAHGPVSWPQLLAVREQVAAYAMSFLVVGLFWLIHVQRFRNLVRPSSRLFWLNLAFLLVIGLVPFTTSLLASSGGATAVQLYAGVMALASLLLGVMGLHVQTAGLDREDGGKGALTVASLRAFTTTGVFLLSIAVSLWNVEAARWSWILLAVVAGAGHRRRA
ncbi:MAG: hypothetical protein BGN86_13945 [Caulobacterales bacterium 68-7]|nr:DUF1211 domain-containing protein [Caulobacterales bacterium]OJU09242.1 MAG: hypothetical protein BGN86_13945 [Caulobacterales bacterium 68-7]